MNKTRVYLSRLITHFCVRQTPASDLRDGMVLLVGGLAAIGVLLIAAIWGLPA